MNIGRSEYYKLKEKENDLKLLIERIKPFAISQDKFDWENSPFVTVAIQPNVAKFFSDMYEKYGERNV